MEPSFFSLPELLLVSVPASESVSLSSLLSDSELVCDGFWDGSEESLEEQLDWERLLPHGLLVLLDRLGDLKGGHSGVLGATEPTEGDDEGGLAWVCSSGSSPSTIHVSFLVRR